MIKLWLIVVASGVSYRYHYKPEITGMVIYPLGVNFAHWEENLLSYNLKQTSILCIKKVIVLYWG